MKQLLQFVMIVNAVIFLLAAIQHTGIAIGPFRQPIIFPATIVESIAGVSLAWGAPALIVRSRRRWRLALITNLIALGGVLLGIVPLAAGRGPRTASNDLHHGIMLALIVISLLILCFGRKGD